MLSRFMLPNIRKFNLLFCHIEKQPGHLSSMTGLLFDLLHPFSCLSITASVVYGIHTPSGPTLKPSGVVVSVSIRPLVPSDTLWK